VKARQARELDQRQSIRRESLMHLSGQPGTEGKASGPHAPGETAQVFLRGPHVRPFRAAQPERSGP